MKIDKIKRTGFGISLIVFPLMLLTGFLMHPHLLSLQPLETVEQLVSRFHHQSIYHTGHLIVMFAVPVIMISQVSIMNVLQGEGKKLGFWGGIIGLFGAIIQAFGLMKELFIRRWQGICIVAGLLLLNNRDIELISSAGAIFMCAGYIPWGVRILQGRMRCSSVTCDIFDTKKDKNFKCAKSCGL